MYGQLLRYTYPFYNCVYCLVYHGNKKINKKNTKKKPRKTNYFFLTLISVEHASSQKLSNFTIYTVGDESNSIDNTILAGLPKVSSMAQVSIATIHSFWCT